MTPSEMERARKLATEMLMERLANDALELEEFERRLDQVNGATSVEAVARILGEVAAARPYAPIPDGWRAPRADPNSAGLPVPPPRRRWLGRLKRNKVVLALQDGSGRVGPWTPSRHVWVINMLGGAVMDFREARLPRGVTELTVFCMMGEVEIIVPLDIQVEFGGLGLIGGFDCESTVGVSNPDAPTLRINGVSCLGGVTVSVRDQGEVGPSAVGAAGRDARSRSAADARRRREAETRGRPDEGRLRPSAEGPTA